GPKALALTGLSITALTTYMLSKLQIDSAYFYIVFLYALRMLGMSLVMMPIMTNGLNQLPTHLNPHGTAINNTAQQISGSIGTAIFITIMNNQTKVKAIELLAGADMSTIGAEQLRGI